MSEWPVEVISASFSTLACKPCAGTVLAMLYMRLKRVFDEPSWAVNSSLRDPFGSLSFEPYTN